MTVSVLLVDDHALLRAGLRIILETTVAAVSVVGEAADGRSAVRMTSELRPHVVMMDVSMPELNGIEATRQILSAHPETKVIGLSMHTESRIVIGMLRAGASAYLIKSTAPEEVVRAFDAVMAGQTWVSPAVARCVVEAAVQAGPEDGDPLSPLTSREREVLQLVAEGHATKEIATRLCVSVKTIETHRKQLMEKLRIRSVAGLTRYALREGLVADGPSSTEAAQRR